MGNRDSESSIQRLRQTIEELAASLAQPTVHDCSAIPRMLSPYFSDDSSILLLGHWASSIADQRYYILSASFYIRGGKSKSLDDLPQAQILRENKDPIAITHFANELGIVDDEYNIVYLSNVTCAIPREIPDDVSVLLANTYQQFLLSSRNFENFLDGQIYHASKPEKAGQAHPRFDTCHDLPAAVRDTFGIQAAYFLFTGSRDESAGASDFRRLDDVQIDNVVQFYEDSVFQKILAGSVKLKQPVVGYSEEPQPTHYCIFPSSDPSIRGSPVEGVFLIWSALPIAMPAFKAAATWLREISARRHVEKARFLTDFRASTESELQRVAELPAPGRQARRESIQSISNLLCERICKLTNAESATVRLRHDIKGIIRLYGSFASPLGQYIKGARRHRPHLDIKVSEWEASAIAFSFRYEPSDRYIYLADVQRIPKRYRDAGLNGVLRVRDSTRCEAILRVRRGNLLTAAINVESPIGDSLRHELGFLADCANILSMFLSRLESIGDRAGLATMAETHVEVHAVKSQLMNWQPDQTKLGIKLLQRLKTKLLEQSTSPDANGLLPSTKSRTVRAFNTAWKRRYRDWLRDTGSDWPLATVFRGRVPPDFPHTDLSSLEVIMDSIWNNIIRHSQLQLNRVALSDSRQAFGKSRVLTISWTAPSRLSDTIDRDRLLLHPATGPGGPHFGFFLIGAHARLLGGHVELEENSRNGSGFMIKAFIPFENAANRGEG